MPEGDVGVLEFECRVRESQGKTVKLPKNDTAAPWHLTPVLSNDMWTGDASVTVHPGSQVDYTVTFAPTLMSHKPPGMDAPPEQEDTGPHQGTLFFALPDGRAVLYQLTGKATEPQQAGAVEVSCAAKAPVTVSVPVKNWLRGSQRFSVTWGDLPQGVHLKASRTHDVPGGAEAEYKATLVPVKPGAIDTTVTFANEASGEYATYAVTITVTEAGVLRTISLEAAVRQSTRHIITVQNPLPADTEVTFNPPVVSDATTMRVVPVTDPNGKTEGSFALEYRPLLETAEAVTGQVTLSSPQLGDFVYGVTMVAKPAAAEQALHFRAALGGEVTQVARIRHMAGAALDYALETSAPEVFTVEKSVKAPAASGWGGDEVEIKVKYEPGAVGVVRGVLTASSAAGGVYKVPLVAECTPPKPAGPFMIGSGASINIPFKNVFADAADFSVSCDNPCFAIGAKVLKLPGKKPNPIAVKYTPMEGHAPAAKVTVTCTSVDGLPPWLFYVQGQQ
jgi:hydrocephalus-inducing protein